MKTAIGFSGRRIGTKAFVLLLASFVAAAGCSSPANDASDDVDSVEQPIINAFAATSNDINAVAIYHQYRSSPSQPWTWFNRPCSGRILTPRAPYKAILTARHCLTETALGNVWGPTIGAPQIRITAKLTPGPVVSSPPADAVQPDSVYPFPPPPNGYGADVDLAIIWVTSPIPGLNTSPSTIGLYLGSTMSLGEVSGTAASLTHWGYGRAAPGQDITAGTLRKASGFPYLNMYFGDAGVTGIDHAGYYFTNSGQNNTQLAEGDSGGPSLRGPHQVGVISTGDSAYAVTRRSVHWIVSQHLGRLYLRPYGSLARGMKWWSRDAGANVTAEMAAADYAQWWEYDWLTHEIHIPWALDKTSCLDIQWNNPADNTPIWMWPCNSGNAQKWIITPQYQIKSEVHGKCIELVNLGMVLKTCSNTSAQKWLWDPDSKVQNWF